MKPLRILARDGWSCLLRAVPLPAFDRLRHTFQSETPGTPAHRRHATLLRRLRYRALTDGPTAFFIQHGTPLQLVNDGSLISRCLYWLGFAGYEPAVADCWARCCAQAGGILEIGCNVGYMTVRGAAAAPGTPYTAAEANPEAVRSLRQNLQLNHLQQVRLVEAAVVGQARTPTMTFCVSTRDGYTAPTGSHLAGTTPPAAHETTVEVPVLEIARLLDGVDTMKLDVEGAELDILAAARETLVRQRVVILVEVLDEALELRRFLADLARTGRFRLLVIGDRRTEIAPDQLPDLALWRTYHSRDLLVVPEERAAALGL